jgi:hypothetical protein
MKAALLMSSYIEFDKAHSEMLEMSWLAQANMCIGPTIAEGKLGYGEKIVALIQSSDDLCFPHRSS